MAERSSIEWTDATWNPVTGCSRVSPGCDNCYAEALSLRFGWSKLPWLPEHASENVVLHPERLRKPMGWREPRMIFVNSMSDLFHAQVPTAFIDDVFGTMARTPQHTYQVLTKRPDRMADYLDGWTPLPNVWIGTSIEMAQFTWRARSLVKVPAAVHFISAEPILGSLYYGPRRKHWNLELDDVEWLIAGGESGPRHRPIDPQWVRELRDACLASGTAFFFKQWGGRTPKAGGRELDGREWSEYPEVARAAA